MGSELPTRHLDAGALSIAQPRDRPRFVVARRGPRLASQAAFVSKTKRSYFWRGVFIACAAVLCFAIVFVVWMGTSYDGKCGGFFPELSVRRPCSLWEYMSGDVFATALIAGVAYWPLLTALTILAVVVDYFIHRRSGNTPP